MLDGSRRLIREWEISSMEEDGCCCCCCCVGETGLHRQNTVIQHVRQKKTRRQRMAQYSAAVVILLFLSVFLALIFTVVLGGRGRRSPDNETMMPPVSRASNASAEQQQYKDVTSPRAMLTAPKGNSSNGEYLEWESKDGNAFCHGGFSYSSGNLVVPRSGIYRVFLQITYESKEGLCRDHEPVKLSNMVVFSQDAYSRNMHLLSSVDTVSCSMEPWSKSLYTAGLFFLEANCRLRVTSLHPELIVKKEYQVFFGAEFLRPEIT